MKRAGRLYSKLIDRENIREAIIKSSKGKRSRKTVQYCLTHQEETIDKIVYILEHGWRPSKPNTFVIYDQHRHKDRTISCPKYFPDQIIHHAIMQVLIPVFMKSMYAHSYGSIPGRGAHQAVKRVHKWMKNNRMDTKYCLQLDISKYYHSISHSLLRHALVMKIKDRKILGILFALIRSYSEDIPNHSIPIGYYTSQWFANFYLEELDHFIKEELRVKYYVRYMDDMLLFGRNKKILHLRRNQIEKRLNSMGLKFKDNWQLFNTRNRIVDFLGYKITRFGITIRSKTYLRVSRKIRRIKKKRIPTIDDYRSIASYKGVVDHTNCYKLKHTVNQLTRVTRKKVIANGGTEQFKTKPVRYLPEG